MERRLAAILVADMVGYSRLMEVDESGTITQQRTHREELIDPSIAKNNGRIVKLMGDGMLVEFASVVDAVQCAVEVQRGMATRVADVPEDRRIRYRIGINLGDVVIEGEDILGQGVNVVARLEGLADPGGVCVSDMVWQDVAGKLDLEFEHQGEHQVKNIEKPIRAYRVLLDTDTGAPANSTKRQGSNVWKRRGVAVAAALLVTAGVAAAWYVVGRGTMPERITETPHGKPSIAVLPFSNFLADPDQEYFADGITEDIITDLAKISGLFVTARNSSFAYKGKQTDVRTVAGELGVRYVLEGSVRRADGQLRINVQLIDATTGGHLWANRYDGALANVFALQDQITDKITKALQVALTPNEKKLAQVAETDSVEAYDAFLKGWERYLRTSPEDFAAAIKHLTQATQLDPDYARAHAALGLTYWQASERDWQGALPYPGQAEQVNRLTWRYARVLSIEHLEKALRRPTAIAHRLASATYLIQRRFAEALAAAYRAVDSDPNDAEALRALAYALVMAGRPEDALPHIEHTRRLDPLSLDSYLFNLGLAQFSLGREEDARQSFERARKHNIDDIRLDVPLAATYGLLGRKTEGEAIIESELERRSNAPARAAGAGDLGPGQFRIGDRMYFWPFQDRATADRFARGLLEVGLAGTPDDYDHITAADRLNGGEIKALLFGRTYRVRLMHGGSSGSITITSEGKASGRLFDYAYDLTGRVWVEGDLLCERYDSHIFLGDKLCSAVFRNAKAASGDEFSHFFVSVTGIDRFAIVD